MDDSRPGASTQWWIESAGVVEAWSAASIMEAVESGELTLDAPARISKDGKPRPLRRYIREIVWSSYQEVGGPDLGEPDDQDPFRVAFQQTDAGMAISDLSGRIIMVNEAFARMVGRSATELVGRVVGELSDNDEHAREAELGNRLFRGELDSYQLRKRFRHKGGSWIPALVNISLVKDREHRPQLVVASCLDLRTEIAAERVRTIERESIAIQRLARGVAHDFSNLLAVIQCSAELLSEHDGMSDNEDIEAISQAARTAATLGQQLRILSTVGTESVSRLELVEEIRERRPLLEHLVAPQQRLVLELADGEVWMGLDELGLEQVLLNLVVNASQASAHDGEIRVQVRSIEGEPEFSVSDDGVGMSEEVQAQIFEPFFSARKGGTGLGLAIVQAALTRQGLSLDVDSKPGIGTTMRVVRAGRLESTSTTADASPPPPPPASHLPADA
jgi:PAS domain S-box-containing protein